MDMCICGHPEREHDQTGECRAAGCRCKHFKPEIGLGTPRPHRDVSAPAALPPADRKLLNRWSS
jgi:hypothetical protein